MKLLKSLSSVGVAAVTAIGLALPSGAQPSPTTIPTTNLVGDYTIGPTYNGVGGNFWSYGTTGLQAATSLKWIILKPVSSLVQNTTLTIPDGGSATDTLVTAKAAQTISGQFTFTTAPISPGYVLSGTNFNATLQVAAGLGQASTLTIPDPGAAAANVLLDAGVTSAVTIQHVAVPLTSANLLAMSATPVNLIPAGAAGTNILVHKVMFTMVRTTTAYASGGIVVFQLGNTATGAGTATTATIAASVLTTAGAATTYTTVIPVSYTGTAATGLFISNQTGAFTTGTGTAVADIWYSIK